MKKVLSVLFTAIFSVILFIPGELKAADISVGAATWYTWWKFDDQNDDSKSEIDPAFLYGPSMAVKFNDDFNFTFQFLYGEFDWTDTYDSEEHKYVFKRIDSDLALNYRVNSWFKIFAGAKYMAYKRDSAGAVDHQGVGPGAGFSAVIPVGMNFYLLGNVSGAFLFGREENEQEDMNLTIKSKYHEYGASGSLALAYYIEAASTTLSIGGRYQYFKTDYYYDSYDDGAGNSDMEHKFYGITASATYSFSL